LVLLARWLDLKQLREAAEGTDPLLFLASLILWMLLPAVAAVRLRVLMGPSTMDLHVPRLCRVQYIALFYGLFLPAGVGSSIARWAKVAKDATARIQFAYITIVEKFLLIAVALAAVGLPLLLSKDERIAPLRQAFLPIFWISSVASPAFIVFLLSQRFHDLLIGVVQRVATAIRLPILNRIAKSLSLDLFAGRYRELAISVGITLVIQGLMLLRMVCMFRAVGVDLAWTTALWVGTVTFLIQVLPISFAGIGVRESTFAYVFSLYGLAPEAGALVGLYSLVHIFANAALGGILELTDKGNEPTGDGTDGAKNKSAPPGD